MEREARYYLMRIVIEEFNENRIMENSKSSFERMVDIGKPMGCASKLPRMPSRQLSVW